MHPAKSAPEPNRPRQVWAKIQSHCLLSGLKLCPLVLHCPALAWPALPQICERGQDKALAVGPPGFYEMASLPLFSCVYHTPLLTLLTGLDQQICTPCPLLDYLYLCSPSPCLLCSFSSQRIRSLAALLRPYVVAIPTIVVAEQQRAVLTALKARRECSLATLN